MKTTSLRSAAAGLLAALMLGAGLASAPSATAASQSPPTRVGWWVGGFAPDCPQGGCPHNYGADVWQALKDTKAFLGVGLTYGTDFGPGATATDALDLVRRANAEGVSVFGWILLKQDQGTFATEGNAGVTEDAVKAFYAWRNDHGLNIPEATLDLELPAGSQELVDANDPAALTSVSLPIDPAHQCEAIRTYRDIQAWSADHGLMLSGSPIPFALDDIEDGDFALSDALNMAPLVDGYKHLYLQAYRTYSNAGPDYVVNYFREMRSIFGKAGEVTLGDTTMAAPYLTVDPLIQDVRLLAGLGASRVAVFNLEGSLSKYGVAGVRQVGAAASKPMSALEISAASLPTATTLATRSFFKALSTTSTTLSPDANRYPPAC